jgi:hypothetical protein
MPIPPIPPHQPRIQTCAPMPPQPPLQAPDSPATAHLKAMQADPHAAFAARQFPTEPFGSYEMPPPTAEAARQFRAAVRMTDPTGLCRAHGEFAQSFRLEGGHVLPNAPIAFEAGNSVQSPAMPPGSFTVFHSHPHAAPPLRNDFPSPDDYLSARTNTKRFGQAHELLYHPASDRFFAYSGSVPPVFFEVRFPGPPPAAPCFGPQLWQSPVPMPQPGYPPVPLLPAHPHHPPQPPPQAPDQRPPI